MTHGDFSRPFPVQFAGSTVARWLLRRMGWTVHFDGLPGLQGVLAVYPHTSNWDFIVLVIVKWAVGIPVRFWGKDSLFRVPLLGRWMRWIGGLPVVRSSPQGLVGDTVAQMRQARDEGRRLWLVVAPEGTRRHTDGWRMGFYRVAEGAGVPVALAVIDFGRREIGLDSFWHLSGDVQADFAAFARRLEGRRGYHPDQAAPIQPLERKRS